MAGDVTSKITIPVEVVGADKAVEELGKVNKEVGKGKKKNEDYTKSLTEASSGLSFMGVSLGGVAKSFRGVVQVTKASVLSFKALKTAIAATGIGLLLIALGSLVTFFQSSEDGQNKLNKIMDVFGVIVGNVTDILANFGKILFNTIGALLRGDFSGALEAAQEGVQDLTAEISNFGAETLKEIGIAQEVADLRAKTDKLERKQLVRRAKIESEIAERRLKAKQEDVFSSRERLKFLEEANELSETLLNTDVEIAQNRLEERQLQNSFSKSSKENLDAEAEAQAQVFKIETARQNARRAIERERIRVLGQIKTEEKAINKQASLDAVEGRQREADLTIQVAENESTALIDISKATMASIDVTRKDNTKLNADAAEINKQIAKDTADANLAAAQFALGGIAALIGEDTAFGKAAAVASSIINTFQGATKALGQGGIFGVASAAGIIAFGLAQVKKIIATPLPEAPKFAFGGRVGGNLHSSGGTLIEAERGEFVINRNAMAMPGVLAAAQALNAIGRPGSLGTGLYQDGGFVDEGIASLNRLQQLVQHQQVVLVTEDLNTVQNRVSVIEDRATL